MKSNKNLFILLMMIPLQVFSGEGTWTHETGLMWRYFPDDIAAPANPMAEQPETWHSAASFSFKTDYVRSFEDEGKQLTFIPFVRIDSEDDARTHADIRELMWKHSATDMDFYAGIGKVFWGVAEGQHLVDVINQTDLVEDIKGEEKLGQFMLRTSTRYDNAALDLFFLTGFRERTLPGLNSRPGVSAALDEWTVEYESDNKQLQPEFAMRWSQRVNDLDWALAYFHGTNREPVLIPATMTTAPIAYYELMYQFSLDGTYLAGEWILKLETLYRHADSENYHAQVYGVEKTFSEFTNKPWEITLYLEYNRDSRQDTALQDDVFAAVRLALNDEDSSEMKLGVMKDIHDASATLRLEASTRFGENWKTRLLAMYFNADDVDDSTYHYQDDRFVQIEWLRYW